VNNGNDNDPFSCREHYLKIKGIIFSANPFTAVNHSHCADVCIPIARLAATVSRFPVFRVDALPRVVLLIEKIVSFLVFIHGVLHRWQIYPPDGSAGKMNEKTASVLSTP
jgi:hypothetical protein